MADGQDSTALMRNAASGDVAAVHVLLAALSDGDGDGRLLDAMLAATDLRLWHAVLRVAAQAALAPPGSSTAPPHLHNDAETLFLRRRQDASDAVRRQALLEGLDSAESSVRAEAATLLGGCGAADALAHLTPLVTDADDHVRAIAQLRQNTAIPVLLRALERRDIVAAEAVDGLIALGSAAVPALLLELRTGSGWTRWHAAKALGSIRDPRALAPLIDALTDENASVRWQARYALAWFGTEAVVPLLRALTQRPVSPWLAAGADHVLRRAAPEELQPRLTALRTKLQHRTAAVEVPVEAAQVLRSLRATE